MFVFAKGIFTGAPAMFLRQGPTEMARTVIIPNTKLITEVVVNNTANNLLREALTVNNIAPDADITSARGSDGD